MWPVHLRVPEANDLVVGLGVADVSKNATKLAKLALLACLPHTCQLDDGFVAPDRGWCVGHLAKDGPKILLSSNTTLPSALAEVPEPVVLLLPVSPSSVLEISLPRSRLRSKDPEHLIVRVWKTTLVEDAEMQYAELDTLVYIARAAEDAGFDYGLQLAADNAEPFWSTLGAPGVPLKVSESGRDGAGYICIPDHEAELPLQPGQVEVKVESAELGTYRMFNSVQDVAGVVTR
ncbi:hypothetical protein G7046_g4675 [Stylonectria norvegica]|nr:hypothetical protein G7046_g4675 [Stylonectria norvegica]